MTSIPGIGITTLPPDTEACARCGVPTSGGRVVLDVIARESRGIVTDYRGKVTFGLCSACEERDTLPVSLLAEHPRVRRALGSPAQHLLGGALDALALLDVEPPATLTDDRLMDLLRLSAVGVSARWSSRFAPILSDEASTRQCASSPWLFVSIEARNEARRLYGDWLADGLPPVAALCPSGGCAWCGVASVLARRSQARTIWTPYNSGHLCPACYYLRERGDDAEESLWNVVDPDRTIRRQFPVRPHLNGVVPWKDAHREPNAEPWGHVDYAALRKAWAPAPKEGPRMIYLDADATVM